MRNSKKGSFLTFALTATIGVTALAGLRAQDQEDDQAKHPKKSEQMLKLENQFPVAEYEALESKDPKEKERRQNKGKNMISLSLRLTRFLTW